MSDIKIIRADKDDVVYARAVSEMIDEAAKSKNSGLAHRTPEYITEKILEGKAVIAFVGDEVAGFCYIATWQNDEFVSHSGLIVNPKFRGRGLAKAIKKECFLLSRDKFPKAKIFGLTTSAAVMKINTELGYYPVAFSDLTTDEEFWKGCETCTNFDILQRTKRFNCLCTGMLFDPAVHNS
ncbi:MAG: GNAT family N-acetyltransferase [Bacteroidales bacterium]|nr:GNAT family N-acetyltransferase [Bacteroidales bacterium]MBQ5541246.1 GNAT family N-acetyltransferase [Bacteroidales bacterium]MBR4676434.1 GNAT family N-acetyltransferase [Bacteroidales bacterium]MCR4559221.1 GNAT family N-acetyltransferase [Bacteroidales bacterium]